VAKILFLLQFLGILFLKNEAFIVDFLRLESVPSLSRKRKLHWEGGFVLSVEPFCREYAPWFLHIMSGRPCLFCFLWWRVAGRAIHDTNAATSVGASETGSGASWPSGGFPPHGSQRPPRVSRRVSEDDAAVRSALEQGSHSVASSASCVARADAAASVRAAWSRAAAKPVRVVDGVDKEHADSAKSAVPVATRPGIRRMVIVRFANRTPASSHTPG